MMLMDLQRVEDNFVNKEEWFGVKKVIKCCCTMFRCHFTVYVGNREPRTSSGHSTGLLKYT